MNYIINPIWFYVIDVLSEIDIVSAIFTVVSGLVSAIVTAIYITSWDDDDVKRIKPFLMPLWILFAVCVFVCILTPSRDTLIEMMIAKYATYDNAQWTIETIKSAVDYIVDAMKQLK